MIKNNVLSDLQKMNNYSSIASDGVVTDILEHIDSGNYMLNALLSANIYGGTPDNRIIVFAGLGSTGKTYLMMDMLKHYLDSDPERVAIFFTTEGDVDKDKLNERGVDSQRVLVMPVKTIEDLDVQLVSTIDRIKEETAKEYGTKKGKSYSYKFSANNRIKSKYMILIDSVAMVTTDGQLSNSIKGELKADTGRKPKLTKEMFAKITLDTALLRTPLLLSTHVYSSIGAWQPTTKVSGGEGLYFAGSNIIELTAKKMWSKDRKKVIGSTVTAHLKKGRYTTQSAKITIDIRFDRGIDKMSGLIEYMDSINFLPSDARNYLFANGVKVEKHKVRENPEKYITKEILDLFNEEVKARFSYGDNNTNDNIESETDLVDEAITDEIENTLND